MNKVEFIIGQLSDDQLHAGVRELKEMEATGILPSGEVRNLSLRLSEEAGLAGHDARAIAQNAILRLAAQKWADSEVSQMQAEHLEDQMVIAVWRGRALRAEAHRYELGSMLLGLITACQAAGVHEAVAADIENAQALIQKIQAQ